LVWFADINDDRLRGSRSGDLDLDDALRGNRQRAAKRLAGDKRG